VCIIHFVQLFKSAVLGAERRAQSATRMTSDILHGMFDVNYLATHTLAGGNGEKEPIEPSVIKAILGNLTFQRHSL